MRNRFNINLVLNCMFAVMAFTCCNDKETISVNRDMIDVGKASVGDSVKAQFKFHNNRKEQITISFLPECDCTTVDADILSLEPRKSGKLEVCVAVENKGEFIKYVYAQASGDDYFCTIAIKGYAE